MKTENLISSLILLWRLQLHRVLLWFRQKTDLKNRLLFHQYMARIEVKYWKLLHSGCTFFGKYEKSIVPKKHRCSLNHINSNLYYSKIITNCCQWQKCALRNDLRIQNGTLIYKCFRWNKPQRCLLFKWEAKSSKLCFCFATQTKKIIISKILFCTKKLQAFLHEVILLRES